MIILDTNVVSEFLRPSPDAKVVTWLDAQSVDDLFLTSVTEAELRWGVATLPNGKRKTALVDTINAMLREDFAGRVLPFDSRAAIEYAAVMAARRAIGKPISQFDAQIAAIARACGATALSTRNVTAFASVGLQVIDPWFAAWRGGSVSAFSAVAVSRAKPATPLPHRETRLMRLQDDQ